jgi:hypothetical protein
VLALAFVTKISPQRAVPGIVNRPMVRRNVQRPHETGFESIWDLFSWDLPQTQPNQKPPAFFLIDFSFSHSPLCFVVRYAILASAYL